MSALPEWLWPMEDEEAVQEAERLIEETHNTLKKMEAGMKIQRTSGKNISEEAARLKSEVFNKMNLLERELKSISEPASVNVHMHKNCSANDHRKLKPEPIMREGHSQQHQPLKASTSQYKSNPKLDDHIEGKPQAQNISSVQSLPKQWKTVNPKWTSSTAEQVVLTARAKVQDALAVARDVTASLDQHVSASSVQSKPMPNLMVKNVGIFEVKSQSDSKTAAPKQRLGQMLLPSISIKRGLEKQSIPSVQVLPGEKTAPSNISVCNIKYDEFKEGGQGKSVPSAESKCKESAQETSKFVQSQRAIPPTSTVTDQESAVVQLSRQLAEVEELREVNQAQVNHVLRFLLSRVCNSVPNDRTTNPPSVVNDQVCDPDQQDKSHTTSSSDSSQYPIAYDSLSRFLETYKKAANQSMMARKRATVRRQKEIAKQKRDIEKAQSIADNHLLIGPLRQAAQVKETECEQSKPDLQDLIKSYTTSSSSHEEVNLNGDAEKNENNMQEKSNQSISLKEIQDWNSALEVSKSSSIESVFYPMKTVGGASGEDYEDDWEEEENHIKSNSDEGESLTNLILPPIIEAEELVSSVTQSENQKNTVVSHKVVLESSDKIINQKAPLEKAAEHEEEEESSSLVNQSPLSDIVERADGMSIQEQQIDNMANEPQPLSNGGSVSKNEQLGGPQPSFAEIGLEKFQSTTNLDNKSKLYQSVRKRVQARQHSLCSSGSDAEVNNDSRLPPRNSRRWDLRLREDLQLQSAILLNWQLEDRLKKNNTDAAGAKDQPNLPTLQTEVLTDIERRWQKTLDRLDQRLKMIEDNERIHHIANEIKLQSRQECPKSTGQTEDKPAVVGEHSLIVEKSSNSEIKVPTKDMMVQTSPEKNKSIFERKDFYPLLTSSKDSQRPESEDRKFLHGSWQIPLQEPEDLTAELLKYSSMGIVPRQGHRERQYSKSSSSSTTSSHFQHSSAMVSLSDGEMKSSACGSCSCSEGEYCVCGGRKLCSERAPPDGSQTFSDGENFLKDVSQGEIPSCKIRHLLRDTSFGEIADHVPKEVSPGDPYMAEESNESDDIEWELK